MKAYDFRKFIAIRAKQIFKKYAFVLVFSLCWVSHRCDITHRTLMTRNYSGKLEFDHEKAELFLSVCIRPF